MAKPFTQVCLVALCSACSCCLLQVLLCLKYAQTQFRHWDGLPENPSICNGNKGMIGLVVQLAILLQLFGGRRSDDVLNMSYMHTKLDPQPVDTDNQVNSVGPSPAVLLKFSMPLNKVGLNCFTCIPCQLALNRSRAVHTQLMHIASDKGRMSLLVYQCCTA